VRAEDRPCDVRPIIGIYGPPSPSGALRHPVGTLGSSAIHAPIKLSGGRGPRAGR
jgi:hypothetical protein